MTVADELMNATLEKTMSEKAIDDAVEASPDMIKQLIGIAKDTKAAGGSRVAAAQHVLNHAIGRASQRESAIVDGSKTINVTINKFFGGEPFTTAIVDSRSEAERDVEDALELASGIDG